MKKKLMFILLVLSMLCFVSCGTGSDSFLLPAEDITIADINKNIDKYWTGKKVPGKIFAIIKGKYAKTMFEASNREVAGGYFYFEVKNQKEIDAINEYVEEFNKNEENNMTIKRYGDVYQLEDGTKYLAFGGRIKMDRLANRR
jgi:hypothetical protein